LRRAKPARGGKDTSSRKTTNISAAGLSHRPSIRRVGEARSHSRERVERFSRQQSLLGQMEFGLYMEEENKEDAQQQHQAWSLQNQISELKT